MLKRSLKVYQVRVSHLLGHGLLRLYFWDKNNSGMYIFLSQFKPIKPTKHKQAEEKFEEGGRFKIIIVRSLISIIGRFSNYYSSSDKISSLTHTAKSLKAAYQRLPGTSGIFLNVPLLLIVLIGFRISGPGVGRGWKFVRLLPT